MSVSVSNLTEPGDPLHELADAYLAGEYSYRQVTAYRSCRDAAATDCLVRVEGVAPVDEGASSSLILYLATLGQSLPGTVDPSALEQGGWGVDPAIFAATEEVGQEDVARRYDFDCRYDAGNLVIEQQIEVSEALSGHFDLTLLCREQMQPGETATIRIVGTFRVRLEDAPYPL